MRFLKKKLPSKYCCDTMVKLQTKITKPFLEKTAFPCFFIQYSVSISLNYQYSMPFGMLLVNHCNLNHLLRITWT